jgi:hypothetical protein
LNYKFCAGFGILEKELWQGPLASSPHRPIAACPGPRARGSTAVVSSPLATSRRRGRPPATPPPRAAHAATVPCALIPRCHGHRRSTPYHDSSRQLAVRAMPRQPRAPPKLGPPLRTVGHRSELTTSHRRRLLPSLRPHCRCRPPSSTLRPGQHYHQLRSSPGDLDVHFNASFDPFSGLPPTTIPRLIAPSWRLNLGESSTTPLPQINCPPSRQPPRATPSTGLAVGRSNFTGEPPASGGGDPLPCFPGWAEKAEEAGLLSQAGRVLLWTEPKVHSTVYPFPLDLF